MPGILLTDDGVYIENGTVQIIPDSAVADDCDCCTDPNDPCPEKRVCETESGFVYPVRRNLSMSVTGIDSTWSGFWEFSSCIGPQGIPPCCSKEQIYRKVSWTINGFGALNGVYNGEVVPPDQQWRCEDVCYQCIQGIRTRYVRITGVVTETFTRTYTQNGSCDDELGSYSWTRFSNVCGIAGLGVAPDLSSAGVGIACLNYDKIFQVDGEGVTWAYLLENYFNSTYDCDPNVEPEANVNKSRCYDITKPWWPYGGYTTCLEKVNSSFPGDFIITGDSHSCPGTGTFSEFIDTNKIVECDDYAFFNSEIAGCSITGVSSCSTSNPSSTGNQWSYKHIKLDPFSTSWTVNISNS